MTAPRERWTLGAKLAATGIPFLLLGLLTTALTLWASWQLDGGAAAVNEVGRLRMQAWRLAWNTTLEPGRSEQAALVDRFEASLALLERGDPDRPLVMPWDAEVRHRFELVRASWQRLSETDLPPAVSPAELDRATTELVGDIDELVSAVEMHLSRFTSLLHLLQVGLLVLGTLASSVLVVTGYHFVIEPVAGLKRAEAHRRLEAGGLEGKLVLCP
jgi:two-component system, NarL family, nitrate/nitrite sensor histidine kinase NarX